MDQIDKDPQIATLRAQLQILEFGSATRRRAMQQKWDEYKPEEDRQKAAEEAAIAADKAGYELIKSTEQVMHEEIGEWVPRDHISPPRRLITERDAEEHRMKMERRRRVEQQRQKVPLFIAKPPPED